MFELVPSFAKPDSDGIFGALSLHLFLLVVVHLLLEGTLVEVLEQDRDEEVQDDLLAEEDEEDPEDGGANGGHGAVEVVEDGGLAVVGEDDEDEGEGV